ncbi:MAG TPA: hypothetical protein VJ552_08630 [Sediminibacterium sp.]|nr:hypothetical protein [Sediminibacterium sp.]
MKTQYIIIALLISLFFSVENSSAQSYKTAAGLRFGGLTSGLTIKHFTNSNTALEGILSIGRKSVLITGLYERHAPAGKNSSLRFLYGAGAHLGFFQDGGSYYYNNSRIYTSTTVIGIDGILGLDYKFNKAPVNISMDIKPFIDFFGGNYIYFDGGISLRYTF